MKAVADGTGPVVVRVYCGEGRSCESPGYVTGSRDSGFIVHRQARNVVRFEGKIINGHYYPLPLDAWAALGPTFDCRHHGEVTVDPAALRQECERSSLAATVGRVVARRGDAPSSR